MLDINFISENLIGKTFISKIYYFKEIDSTNNYAKKLNREDNVLVIAEYQSSGKGRFERKWESEPGMNLTFTIKKKFDINPQKNSFINFYFTYFLYSSLRKFLEKNYIIINTDSLEIKWPNDILLNSKKISGLLIESSLNKNEYIIGIGLNVNQKIFKEEFNSSSLINHTNTEIDLNNLLINIITEFDKNLHLLNEAKFSRIFKLWKSSTKMIGKTVYYSVDGGVSKTSKIIDLADDGSIKLLINNEEKSYYSGEVKITDI